MANPPPEPARDRPFEPGEIVETPFEELIRLEPTRLEETSSALLARLLERFETDQRRALLRVVSETKASDILAEMDEEDAAEVVGAMRESRALRMLEGFDPDDAADVVSELEEKDRNRLMGKLEPETADDIKLLLSYDPETAGGVMTTEIATVLRDQTIEEAIHEIRRQREELEQIYYVYVVDHDRRLEGVVSLRELLLARRGARIEDIMFTQVRGVCSPEDDREIVAMRMAEYNLAALPVVDSEGRLIGTVTHDDVLDILQEEATEDIQKMVGAGADEDILDPIGYSLKKRNPWLLVNLVTISLAAGVISFYEEKIAQVTLLAVIMPMIVNLGGNTGAQTLAVLIRSLAVGQIQTRDTLKICFREAFKGLMNGILIGLISGLALFALTGTAMILLTVFLAMVFTMTFAGFIGAFIPLFLKHIGQDPAQSSSIFLTGIVDIVGFVIFLQLGSWLLL